jgi:anti-sigma factor ChrR (cupin superfamily)
MIPDSAAKDCGQIGRVATYALGALPRREIPKLETHMGGCVACQAELDRLSTLVNALADWPIDHMKPPESVRERLEERIAAELRCAVVLPRRRLRAVPDWREVAPGISCKLLSMDAMRNRVSMLVRLVPGGEYPAHTHAGVEELHLLDGELWIDNRKLQPGDYNRAEPGTSDKRVWSETGCTCVLVTSPGDVLG